MKGKPTLEEGEPTGVEKEPTGLAKRDIVRRDPCPMLMLISHAETKKRIGRVTLTGVVPSGESHPEEGEEEKSCRRGEREEWDRGEMRERRGCEG